jgi:hypothetical protein
VDGFHGEIHPLLHHHFDLPVKADWTIANTGRLFPGMPAELNPVRRLYTTLTVAVPTRSYSERDFSALLPPESIQHVGGLWAIDPAKAVIFLKQFHPQASPHSASIGRRPGPDGAFGILRGVSESHLDIAFRVHAEFELAPKSGYFPAQYVWYTPACFLGRIIVNRKAGTIEYFRLGVPTDIVRNIHGTVLTAPDEQHPDGYRVYQFMRADRMELVGGHLPGMNELRWTEEIDPGKAHDTLAKIFYKFKEIDFVPFSQVQVIARQQNKPIFAFVALGALDDQSC